MLMDYMGKIVLRAGGCPCSIYLILWDKKTMTLKDIYDKLKSLYGKSSIRRSLYSLRDAGAVYKIGSDVWCFDNSKRPLEIKE